jgi:hypothetical protein
VVLVKITQILTVVVLQVIVVWSSNSNVLVLLSCWQVEMCELASCGNQD